MNWKQLNFSLEYLKFTCTLIYAIFDISVIENCQCFDLYNIMVYVVIYYDDKFSLSILEKFPIEGYSLDTTGSMVKYYAS